MSADELKLTTTQEKIKACEDKYKELILALDSSKKQVHCCESDLIECMQNLMPLQNMYLTNIIVELQKKITELENAAKESSV